MTSQLWRWSVLSGLLSVVLVFFCCVPRGGWGWVELDGFGPASRSKAITDAYDGASTGVSTDTLTAESLNTVRVLDVDGKVDTARSQSVLISVKGVPYSTTTTTSTSIVTSTRIVNSQVIPPVTASATALVPGPRRGHSATLWNGTTVVVLGGRQLTSIPSPVTFVSTPTTDCGRWNECSGRGTCTVGPAPITICVDGQTAFPTLIDPATAATSCPSSPTINNTVETVDHYCRCDDGYDGLWCQNAIRESFFNDLWLYDIVNNSWVGRFPAPAGSLLANSEVWIPPLYEQGAVILDPTGTVTPTNPWDDHILYVYGGYSQFCVDYCADIWEYRFLEPTPNQAGIYKVGAWFKNYGVNESDSSARNPGKRWLHSTLSWNGTLLIFGGHRSGQLLNDVWQMTVTNDTSAAATTTSATHGIGISWGSVKRWTELTPAVGSDAPHPRIGHASAISSNFHTGHHYLFIYGGYRNGSLNRGLSSGSGFYLDDFWKFNLVTRVWHPIVVSSSQQRPPAMMYLSAVMAGAGAGSLGASSEDVFFMFGGFVDGGFTNALWRYNTTSGYWTQHLVETNIVATPYRRVSRGLVYDEIRKTVIVFGGVGSDASGRDSRTDVYFNDCWMFDPELCPANCNGRGHCEFGYCICDPGFSGPDCSNDVCGSDDDSSGSTIANGDECYYDVATRLQTCQSCSDHGTCYLGMCRCHSGFGGVDCSLLQCSGNCTNRGSCVMGTSPAAVAAGLSAAGELPVCICHSNSYTGADCSFAVCPNSCNNHGTCNNADATCQCASDSQGSYTGDDCSICKCCADCNDRYRSLCGDVMCWFV